MKSNKIVAMLLLSLTLMFQNALAPKERDLSLALEGNIISLNGTPALRLEYVSELYSSEEKWKSKDGQEFAGGEAYLLHKVAFTPIEASVKIRKHSVIYNKRLIKGNNPPLVFSFRFKKHHIKFFALDSGHLFEMNYVRKLPPYLIYYWGIWEPLCLCPFEPINDMEEEDYQLLVMVEYHGNLEAYCLTIYSDPLFKKAAYVLQPVNIKEIPPQFMSKGR